MRKHLVVKHKFTLKLCERTWKKNFKKFDQKWSLIKDIYKKNHILVVEKFENHLASRCFVLILILLNENKKFIKKTQRERFEMNMVL